MTISVIGCGESAKDWFRTPCDVSIGVNDCLKFGQNVDHLICVNSPLKFTPDRMKYITSSEPGRFHTHSDSWKQHFPNAEKLHMRTFQGYVKKGQYYKSSTSPFIAISMAYNLNVKDIILWGVDFLTHKRYHEGNKALLPELKNYLGIIEAIQKQGVKVWIGNDQTILRDHLKIYNNP